MSEREAKRRSREVPSETWDIAGVGNVLNVPSDELRDVALGVGHRFVVPEGEHNIAAELDLYPQRRLLRYRSASLRLQLANVTVVKPQEKLLQVESRDQTSRSVFFVQPNGGFALTAVGLSTQVNGEAVHATAENVPADEAEGLEDVPTENPADVPVGQTGQMPPKPGEPEKPNRVVLTGRIGRAPLLRETPNKRLIARMPLAVHEGEKTIWHTVLFFDEKATKAAEELAKGEVITVIGYRHVRDVPTRAGMKQVEQIFAAAVQKPRQNAPDVITKPQ